MELRFGFCAIFSAFTPFFHVPEVFLSCLSRLPQAPGLASGLPVRRSLPHVFGLVFGLQVRLSLSHAFGLAFGLPGPPVSLSLSLCLSLSKHREPSPAYGWLPQQLGGRFLSLSLSLSLSSLVSLLPWFRLRTAPPRAYEAPLSQPPLLTTGRLS